MPSSLRVGAAILALTLIVGPIGYVLLGGLSIVDAVYMTVITITTVGFSEIGGPYGPAARMWTVAVIIVGSGGALYTLYAGLEYGVEALLVGRRERRRVERTIANMRDHVILCGFGAVGRTAWETLVADGAQVAVVEKDPAVAEQARKAGALVIAGDATDDARLEEAGVARAKVVIPAVASDSDNLVITLSAKALNPSVTIIARAIAEQTQRKLYLAGADRVVAPQSVGGQRLAALALRPDLAEFVDFVVSGRTVEFVVEVFVVPEDSPVVGRTLREIRLGQRGGPLVVGIGDDPSHVVLNPPPDVALEAGQMLIVIGSVEQLERLSEILGT